MVGPAIGGWNLYVSRHNDGILAGTVSSPDGRPAAGVTVTLSKQELIGLEKVTQATTGADGAFRFERHNQHHPILSVGPSGARSAHVGVRLPFRNPEQDA